MTPVITSAAKEGLTVAADTEEEILDMVRRQLKRPNPPGTEVLYGRAARIDEGSKS